MLVVRAFGLNVGEGGGEYTGSLSIGETDGLYAGTLSWILDVRLVGIRVGPILPSASIPLDGPTGDIRLLLRVSSEPKPPPAPGLVGVTSLYIWLEMREIAPESMLSDGRSYPDP
jgi:hypothetical protein